MSNEMSHEFVELLKKRLFDRDSICREQAVKIAQLEAENRALRGYADDFEKQVSKIRLEFAQIQSFVEDLSDLEGALQGINLWIKRRNNGPV